MQQQFTAIEIIRHSGNSHNKSCTTYILTPSHMIIIRFNVRLFYVTSSRKSSHNNYKSSQQLQEFTTLTRVHNNCKSSQQLQEFTTITRVHNNYMSSQQLQVSVTILSIKCIHIFRVSWHS